MRDWKPRFREIGAIWEWQGGTAPHAGVLKSPNHTLAYFNSDLVEQDLDLMQEIAEDWADVILDQGHEPDRVVGHAPYAIVPATVLADVLRARGLHTRVAYAARDSEGGYSTTFPIEEDEQVIALADDVVSGESTRKTIRDLVRKGARILPLVPCIANLSNRPNLEVALPDQPALDLELVAASTYESVTTPIDECRRPGSGNPCALGSRALQPRLHWDELIASMPPAAG